MTQQIKPASQFNPVIDRRLLLRAGVFGLVVVPGPAFASQFSSARGFTHNVASGEPGTDRVLLWTRYVAEQDTTLAWEVSDNAEFSSIISQGSVIASPDRDWCCKTWANGLMPGKWYYFRFVSPEGTISPVGRTRTLPVGETARWRMAVFSCSNLRFGWFNAYAHACEDNSFDCTVHTGDYFYEYQPGRYPSEKQALAARQIWPDHEIIALADYRLRYASYRMDRDLQRLHQLYPMIAGWDDHESANDSWKGGAENHEEGEGDWQARKAAAMRAYREWMPVSDEPWASYQIGDLATIFRVESRLTGRDKAPSLGAVLRGLKDPAAIEAALVSFRDGDWADPSRSMFGAQQEQWLEAGLAGSKSAGTRWQVLAQQTVMGRLVMPEGIAEGVTADTPDFVKQRLKSLAKTTKTGVPFNMDAWGGYPAARQKLLDAAKAADAELVVLSGDSHNAWACELDGAGVEFAGHSVSSPGAEGSLSWISPKDLSHQLAQHNPELAWANTKDRGYMAVELTQSQASSEWRFLDTVRERSTRLAGAHRMIAPAGARRFAS